MQQHDFQIYGQKLSAFPSGVLWWAEHRLMCVSDMHLGKSERIARRSGGLLPPFETQDTLDRLSDEILRLNPNTVVCLGDSFDDLEALDSLTPKNHKRLTSLIAGRDWVWIEGNHDPGPVDLGGSHVKQLRIGPLTFRHIAELDQKAEISGHYHPKARIAARGRGISRACFVVDDERLIMPAFGTYTGGLISKNEAITKIMANNARVFLLGNTITELPLHV